MSLSFANQSRFYKSRFYDATRRVVRFWGHDSAMEASFFVTDDALKQIKPDMRFRAGDGHRRSIYNSTPVPSAATGGDLPARCVEVDSAQSTSADLISTTRK